MRATTIVLLALALLAMGMDRAQASDEKRFENLVKKYALSKSDLDTGKFKPKAGCVCHGSSGDDDKVGFLLYFDTPSPLTGSLLCLIPHSFDAEGSYAGGSECSGDWEILAK